MNNVSDLLREAEAEPARFDSSDVRARVARRSRLRRRRLAAAGAGALAAMGAIGLAVLTADDSADVVTEAPPATTPLVQASGGASLLGTVWRLTSVDGLRYEEFSAGWGGTNAGRVARPSMLFNDRGFARLDTGCIVIQFGWVPSETGFRLSGPHVPNRSCGAETDELDSAITEPLREGTEARLDAGEFVYQGLVFEPDQPFDLGAIDGWQLASINSDPSFVSAWIDLPADPLSDWQLSVANCDGGQFHQMLVDTTDEAAVLAIAGGGDTLCDGTSPDPVQVEIAGEVLSSTPSLTLGDGDLILRAGGHSLRFAPPPPSAAEGLIGHWTPAYVDGERAVVTGPFLVIDEEEFSLSGCPSGSGSTFAWEADAALRLGPVLSTHLADCGAAAAGAVTEAENLQQLLADMPDIEVLPEAFVVTKDGRSAAFVRDEATGLDPTPAAGSSLQQAVRDFELTIQSLPIAATINYSAPTLQQITDQADEWIVGRLVGISALREELVDERAVACESEEGVRTGGTCPVVSRIALVDLLVITGDELDPVRITLAVATIPTPPSPVGSRRTRRSTGSPRRSRLARQLSRHSSTATSRARPPLQWLPKMAPCFPSPSPTTWREPG